MSTTRTSRIALLLGFLIVLGAGSGSSEAPNALAFADGQAVAQDDLVRRPVGNPCGSSDYSVTFDEGVSLADAAVSNVGPFTITLPDGVYDVTVSTWLGGQDVPQETHEQWSFSTDSGYQSPTTVDSSPNLLMNQAWTGQEIGATTSVELQHRAPSVSNVANAVHPLCIGFDAVDVDYLDAAAEPEILP